MSIPKLLQSTTKLAKQPIIKLEQQLGKRTFGLEIESMIPKTKKHQKPSDLLSSLNLKGSSWHVVEDNSIETGHTATHKHADPFLKCEFVSPKLEFNKTTMRQLENLCNNLQYKVKANTNESCGLHIHFDTEDLTINDIIKVAANYAFFEPVIDQFMNKTRMGNGNKWIQSIQKPVNDNINNLTQILDNPSYNKTSLSVLDMINPNRKCHKYNFTNLFYYNLNKIGMGFDKSVGKDKEKGEEKEQYINTIENRHHHSTFNYEDILNWVRFNLLFIHHSVNKPLSVNGHIKSDIKNDSSTDEKVYVNPIDPITHLDLLSDFIDNDEIMEFYQQKIAKK